MEREEEREKEKVLVPVLRRESIAEEAPLKELTEEDCEAKIWEAPRRWRAH